MKQNETNLSSKVANDLQCICGIYFNSRTTLWRHKKVCTHKFESKENNSLLEYLIRENCDLKKDNNELKSMIIDACKNIHSITPTKKKNETNYNKNILLNFI